jgi:HYDIN/CFA65/VesB-like, Ig-like domain
MGNRIHAALFAFVLLLLWTTSSFAQSSCTVSSWSRWTNTSFAPQTAPFTATFDATPSRAGMDGVIGFSPWRARRYENLAAIVRFADSGSIDVRNGDSYAADVPLPYEADASYRFRVAVDPSAQRYSVYVTAPGEPEVILASNYAFRSEQSTASSLADWAMYADSGRLTVCNMSVDTTPTVTTETKLLSANPSLLNLGDVNVGGISVLGSTLTATGNSSVTVSNISISGPGVTASGVSVGQVILPGQAATLNVTFTPSLIGAVAGSITVTSDAANSPTTISLLGVGVQLLSHSATLSWLASGSSSVVGYNVYSGTTSGGPYTRITASPIGATTYRDDSVDSGQTYYYVVTAVNSSNAESAYSNQASASIP